LEAAAVLVATEVPLLANLPVAVHLPNQFGRQRLAPITQLLLVLVVLAVFQLVVVLTDTTAF
jgi:hypothetical protein